MSDRPSDDNQPKSDDISTSKLVNLADYDPNKPTRILAEMRDYWQSLRRGKAIPLRSDIDPRGISRGLDFAFVLERMAPGSARFRLAGRHLVELMGMEVRGMPLCAVMNPSSRGRLSDVLEAVFRAPQLAELDLKSEAEYGRPALIGRMLLLPLKSDLGDVTRVLGCLISEGSVGVSPRRFDLVRDQMLPIIEGGRTIEPSPSYGTYPSLQENPAHRTRNHPAFGTDAVKMPAPRNSDEPLPDSPEERRASFKIIASEPEDGSTDPRF